MYCDSQTYETNYDKPMDLVMKKVAVKYHTHPEYLVISPESQPTNSMLYSSTNILYKYSTNITIIIVVGFNLIVLYSYLYFLYESTPS